MSIKSKTTQHKPTRDDRRNKDFQDLKSENRSLRKQLARQRKLAQQVVDVEPADPAEEGPKHHEQECIKCGSTALRTMTLPTGTILTVCKDCGEKSKKPL